MADRARKATDARLREMEAQIRAIYTQARAEITEKWDDYMRRGQLRLDDLYAAYASAPPAEKAAALARYQQAAQNYTLRNRWYREMVRETTYRLANTNEIAAAYLNGRIPEIYLINFNQIDPEVADIGINWTIRNEHTIKNLILPERSVNYAKDMAWNSRQINSAVLQGILQGEGIPKIAKRLLGIVDNNRAAAVRTARTMVTGAENKGRQDRYAEYESEGIVMSKVWIATPDSHTRAWHLSMDGQEVGVNEYFIDGHGNELEYPGDPEAEPETVYNCRCSMRSHLIGIKGANGKVEKFKDYRGRSGESLHQRQIGEEKSRRE